MTLLCRGSGKYLNMFKNDIDKMPRILIADDNPKNIQLLAKMLEKINYELIIARNGTRC